MRKRENVLKIILILSTLVLIVNDHYLKIAYHNQITGKLSDIFGLLAVSIFICIQTNKYRIFGLITLGILFVFWKSSLSSPIIEFANFYSFPIGRAIDYSDLIALPIIILPLLLINSLQINKNRLGLSPWLGIICIFAFVATTLPPREKRSYLGINKSYTIDLPIDFVVSKINLYQNETLKRYGNYVDFDSETGAYYHRTSKEKIGQLIDVDELNVEDTLAISNAFADITIFNSKAGKTKIKLINVYKIVPIANNKDYESRAIREFENKIINPLLKDSKNYLVFRFEGPINSIQEILGFMKKKFAIDSKSICDYVLYNSEVVNADSNLLVTYNHTWPILDLNTNSKDCDLTFEINSVINQSKSLKETKLNEVKSTYRNEKILGTDQFSQSVSKAIVINGVQYNPYEIKTKILSLSVSGVKSIFITTLPASKEIYGELGKNGLIEIQLYRNKI